MHSLGEGFMLVDQISQRVRVRPEQARRLADPSLGVGFKQLLLLEPPFNPDADFSCRAFNTEGQEVVANSNGLRCFAAFVVDKKLTSKKHLVIETLAGKVVASVESLNQVTLQQLPPPAASYAVTQVEDVLNLELHKLGKAQANNKAQVCFVQLLAENQVRLRVYSAATGEVTASSHSAMAALVHGRAEGWLQEQVEMHLLGGVLTVVWQGENQPIELTGYVHKAFEGQLIL